MDSNHIPSCTSAGSVLQLCKVSQNSNKPFKRSYAYKVHNPPFRESISWIISPSNGIPSCTSTGCVLQLCKVSHKFNKQLSRSCTYKVHIPPFHESISWIIFPFKFWTATILLQAHLQVVYYNCVMFHKTPISRLGEVALTRYTIPFSYMADGRTDGRMDRVIPIYPLPNFACGGYTYILLMSLL